MKPQVHFNKYVAKTEDISQTSHLSLNIPQFVVLPGPVSPVLVMGNYCGVDSVKIFLQWSEIFLKGPDVPYLVHIFSIYGNKKLANIFIYSNFPSFSIPPKSHCHWKTINDTF